LSAPGIELLKEIEPEVSAKGIIFDGVFLVQKVWPKSDP
jgi:hypothetical protein